MRRSSHFALRCIKGKRIPEWPTSCTSLLSPSSVLILEGPATQVNHNRSRPWAIRREFSSTSTHAVLTGANGEPNSAPLQSDRPHTKNIRQRLRSWEAENITDNDLNLGDTLSLSKSRFANFLLPPENDRDFNKDEEDREDQADQPVVEDGELVDFGNHRTFFVRGDLVELRISGALGSELAIFILQAGTQSLFYGMSGNFILDRSKAAQFYVPKFVEPHKLDPLSKFLPNLDMLQSTSQRLEHAPPRNVGSTLIRKMLEFSKASDDCYRVAASRLDNAHEIVARKSTMRYASLQKIAHEVLGESFTQNGEYSAPMLRTLHRTLLQNDTCFRAQRSGWHRTWGQFEITSKDDLQMIGFVTRHVRKYQTQLVAVVRGQGQLPVSPLLHFLHRARILIDESRATRKHTSFGMIGPMDQTRKDEDSTEALDEKRLRGTDNAFIRFIFAWAGLEMFGRSSHLHGIAAAILRATGKYDDLFLDQTVGWTFLQEIGVIAPWENRAQFDLRLSEPEVENPEEDDLGPDVVESLRKDWENLPVYCIDDKTAREIDDGVSIEPADGPDEYWIHIHAADPASRIQPRSRIGRSAESMIRSLYLPERMISMLPSHVVHDNFSLAPNRPCLTFSARLNRHGHLLEEKVTPGIVRNVVYMTPATVSSVIGENITPEEIVMTLGEGENQSPMAVNRPMLERQDLTGADEENLKLLDSLGKAREALATAKGAVNFTMPTFSSTVNLNQEVMSPDANHFTSQRPQQDPDIQLRADNWDPVHPPAQAVTVKNLMLLGGEIAARWCHARGIPVINRVTQLNPDGPDPREFFRKKIQPTMSSNATATTSRSANTPSALLNEYLEILGVILPSTTAGPHLALGLDMFTRATSPLRRYTDLILHWQVEAALLEEKKRGKSLVGSQADDYLPFSRDQLNQLIPFLDSKERALSVVERDTKRFWALQLLLRAWKFKGPALPPTYRFVVRRSGKEHVVGDLVSLGGLGALMPFPTWMAAADIKAGDVFEVKLLDLNVYSRRLRVEGIRCVDEL